MDAFVLARLAAALQDAWTGAWVQGVWEDTTARLILKLRHRGCNGLLLLSGTRAGAGLGLVRARPPCPSRPTALAAYLRAHGHGTLRAVSSVPHQRIVELELGSPDDHCTVVLEALPRAGRILALDADRVVRAGSAGTAGEGAGRPYSRPELPPGRRLPFEVGAGELAEWLETGESLQGKVFGLGRELAAEVLHRARDGDVSGAWQSVGAACAGSGPLWLYDDGPYAVELTHRDGSGARRLDVLEAAGEHLMAAAATAEILGEEAETARQGERFRRRIRRRIENIRADLESLADPAATRERADALGASLWLVKTGQESITVPDPRDPARAIEISLDPSLTPGENLDRQYRQARKQERSRGILAERLAAAERELRSGPPPEKIADRPPADRRDTGPYRRYRSSDGWPIQVGRNGSENDRLVREAKPWDLWLHVRDAAGAHVVIRKPGRESRVPERTLIEAAGLAAHFSNRSADGAVEVMVAEIARLRKPKGASPGQVLVAGDRTVRVPPGAGNPRPEG